MFVRTFLCCVVGLGLFDAVAAADQADRPLFPFTEDTVRRLVEPHAARATLVSSEHGGSLRVETRPDQPWPGALMKAPQGTWDLSACEYVAVDVKNAGRRRVAVYCRVDSVPEEAAPAQPGGKIARKERLLQQSVFIGPGEVRTIRVTLVRRIPDRLAGRLFAMRGNPGGVAKDSGLDPSRVVSVLVFVDRSQAEHTLEVASVRAGGNDANYAWLRLSEADLFPLIDCYGQFRHKTWPGKIGSDDDLRRRREDEGAQLAAAPGPADWCEFGGWKAGPHLAPGKFFRVEKREGKWWLVDPHGHLFWSHGVDCVNAGGETTPITDRKFYYAELPPKNSPEAGFYGRGNWAPHNYYEGRSYETFNFSAANLRRKYGPDFAATYSDVVHRRLRGWAVNTIGNWSSREIARARRTPYVATVASGATELAGSTGYWGRFPDPFDPKFEEQTLAHCAAQKGGAAGDPWCLGFFVDNELAWGDDLSLAEATLKSPAGQPAKSVFVDDLRRKYGSIEKLNAAWKTAHASWDALRESRLPPSPKDAAADLGDFYTKLAEQYFRVCSGAVRRHAPGQLYLGCRFAWGNDRAARAAAKFCDAISFNIYSRSPVEKRLPEGVDKPMMIGEFHFGAMDRGMFHTGLVPTRDQTERAAAYRKYVTDAIRHPQFIGTHWFQYSDQATTGRGDGENYQIGLVDICDTPYPETIEAVRQVGRDMYRMRLEAK
jgi:hypothetical protein